MVRPDQALVELYLVEIAKHFKVRYDAKPKNPELELEFNVNSLITKGTKVQGIKEC